MGRVIAVANQKGGVGKTTTTVNLAACLAAAQHRTLLFDLDPQADSTTGCGAAAESLAGSTYEVLLGLVDLRTVIRTTEIPDLSLVPSHVRLAGAEVELASALGRERKLERVLAEVREEYDFVVIDCPPSLGLLTVNALTAADSVLIPVQCEYYALEGLSSLLGTVRLVQRHLNPRLRLEGVVLTMYDERLQLARRVATEVRSFFGAKVFTTAIRRNVSLAEAPSFGQPITVYDPDCTGAANYTRLAAELCDLVHGADRVQAVPAP